MKRSWFVFWGFVWFNYKIFTSAMILHYNIFSRTLLSVKFWIKDINILALLLNTAVSVKLQYQSEWQVSTIVAIKNILFIFRHHFSSVLAFRVGQPWVLLSLKRNSVAAWWYISVCQFNLFLLALKKGPYTNNGVYLDKIHAFK